MPCKVPRPLYDVVAPMLARHEDKRSHPYNDTTGREPVLATPGKITIGIGRNLTDRGLSEAEIYYLFNNDLYAAYLDARKAVGAGVFDGLTINRQAALVNMAFNLGLDRLLGFKNTLLAIKLAKYNEAADGMRSSLWARQVGARATFLADLMEKG